MRFHGLPGVAARVIGYSRNPRSVGPCSQRSTTAATPMPPAVQTEMSPRPPPRSSISLASVPSRRAPVAAKGCPIARLLPVTFNFARSMAPSGCGNPSRSRQKSTSSQALRVHNT